MKQTETQSTGPLAGLQLTALMEGDYPQSMNFDPAIAARESLRALEQSGQLGEDWPAICDAEEVFSAGAGEEASHAYRTLQDFGLRHLHVKAFQQFLIYITWQQVVEHTSPSYFSKGLELCNRYLHEWGQEADIHLKQIQALRESFRAGLGLSLEEPDEYERDTIKGGD